MTSDREFTPAAADATRRGITGRVRHTDREPFEAVPLTVTTADGDHVAVLHSDAEGRFTVDVPAGDYLVIASPPGCAPDARRVQVTGDAPAEVSFALDGDAMLYGRVTGASTGVLMLLDDTGVVVAVTDIGEDGSYELAGLRSGAYVVAVVVPGAAPLTQPVTVESGDARRHDLGLGPIDLTAAEERQTAGKRESSSPFGPGLHPVAMVRGGTGIAGLPSRPNRQDPNGPDQ